MKTFRQYLKESNEGFDYDVMKIGNKFYISRIINDKISTDLPDGLKFDSEQEARDYIKKNKSSLDKIKTMWDHLK